MYYKSVNRGLAFTKPGVYAFAFVLVLGLIAVASGINGLFVFLSVGLGGFIISGLLSEKAMKTCTVKSVAAKLTDASTPFDVAFTVTNSSSWFSVYSMRGLFLLEAPPFRLIAKEPPSVASVRLVRVPPASTVTHMAQSRGMPRGEYRQIKAMQLTTFPFGILEKFKLVDVPASLIIAPAVDQQVLEEMRSFVRSRILADDADKEFFGHRQYVARDSLKHVDWKKSAARVQQDWVVKLYRSPRESDPVTVSAPLEYAAALANAEEFESYWVRVRTLLKVLDEAQYPYELDVGVGSIHGSERALQTLAAIPDFKSVKVTSTLTPRSGTVLLVTMAGVELTSGQAGSEARA